MASAIWIWVSVVARRSEAFLAEAQALSQTGSFGWSTATGELFWSRETYRIFGVAPDVLPTLSMLVDVVHPDDRARFMQEVERFGRDRTDFEHEYRVKLGDGSIKHVYAVGRFAVRGFPNLDVIGAYYHYNQNTFTNAGCASLASHRVRLTLPLRFSTGNLPTSSTPISASCSHR